MDQSLHSTWHNIVITEEMKSKNVVDSKKFPGDSAESRGEITIPMKVGLSYEEYYQMSRSDSLVANSRMCQIVSTNLTNYILG